MVLAGVGIDLALVESPGTIALRDTMTLLQRTILVCLAQWPALVPLPRPASSGQNLRLLAEGAARGR